MCVCRARRAQYLCMIVFLSSLLLSLFKNVCCGVWCAFCANFLCTFWIHMYFYIETQRALLAIDEMSAQRIELDDVLIKLLEKLASASRHPDLITRVRALRDTTDSSSSYFSTSRPHSDQGRDNEVTGHREQLGSSARRTEYFASQARKPFRDRK